MRTYPVPNAPMESDVESVTNVATAALGAGKSGRYLFTVTGPYTAGTDDLEDLVVWVTFGRGTPATPVAGTTGSPLVPFKQHEFVLGEGVYFRAISSSTTVNLSWARVDPE